MVTLYVTSPPHRNVITALGHFSSWIMEILVFGVLEYVIVVTGGKVSLAHYVFLFLVPSINYVVFPIVQTLSSHDLRYICEPRRPMTTNELIHD